MQKKRYRIWRSEDGQRGEGRWPPQEQDGNWGKRSMAEEWRPPERSSGWCRHSTGSYSLTLGEWRHQHRRHSNISDDPLRVESMRDKGPEAPARPKLHIDDGCMGGGGDKVNFDEYLDFDEEFNDLKWGEGWSKKLISGGNYQINYGTEPHFTQGRWHIFHYCIFGNKKGDLTWKEDWFEMKSVTGEYGGDDFAIWKDEIHTISIEAQSFLHELGHNTGIAKTSSHHCNNDCIMETNTVFTADDFCSKCWNDMELTLFMDKDKHYDPNLDYYGWSD